MYMLKQHLYIHSVQNTFTRTYPFSGNGLSQRDTFPLVESAGAPRCEYYRIETTKCVTHHLHKAY